MKLPLTLDEQIKHLKENKKVVFIEVTEEEAKRKLQLIGYGNLITAHKHHFHNEKDSNGNHIYSSKTDFKRFLEKHEEELRENKKILYPILNIENTLNTLVVNSILLSIRKGIVQDENLTSGDYFEKFKEMMGGEEAKEKSKLTKLNNEIDSEIKRSNNIYLAFAMLNFSSTILMFNKLDENSQNEIFKLLVGEKLNLGTSSVDDYLKRLYKIKEIRNFIVHNNSLNFLIRYKKRGSRDLRNQNERKKYHKIINQLIKENEKGYL